MRALALVLLLAAGFALSACGSDDSPEGSPPAASAGQTIEISASDFKFDPPNIPLEQAGEYTFRLTNDGGAPHALEIEGAGIEEAASETIQPGESTELTVELQEGEYEMYCPVDGHREMGMEGTLVVGGGAAGTGATTEDDGTTTEDDGTTTEDSGGYNY
jgi:plastocyanin